MVRCLLVDDEPLALQLLEGYINQTKGLRLVQKCSNAMEAYDAVVTQKIDLLFLDIQMPALNGIDFIRSLKQPPAVIFTTAFSEYAAYSYELEAVDYLLKPITYERFAKSMDKFFKNTVPAPPSGYTYFKVDGSLVKIEHLDILYAQSIRDYIIIKTRHKNYITHMTMKSLAEMLPGDLFRRVHRSFLIGSTHITAIGKKNIALGDVHIPMGKNYRMDRRAGG